MTVKEMLQPLRERMQKHSTRDIHRASGVSEIILRRIKNGLETNPRMHTVFRIGQALNSMEGMEND